MIAPWAESYVGVPWDDHGTDGSFAGCNCYGLVRLVYRRELGIDLPRYEGAAYTRGVDPADLAQLFVREREKWRDVDTPQAGDLIWLRIAGRPFHVGVMVSGDAFLHIEEGCDSIIESTASTFWRRRIQGYARW
jgi:cell wall-associated NlpC family hydrolase